MILSYFVEVIVIKTALQLQTELEGYASPKSKITHMIKRGEIFRVSKGVYVTSLQDPKFPVAAVLRSPSYISFQTALSYHQILPERTHAVMSAGFRLNKEYTYDTPLGRYSFHYIPERVFSIGIIPAEEEGAGFRIASAEKALCDTLYKIRKIENSAGISELLFEDLRIERESIDILDWDLITSMVPLYRSTTLRSLMKWKKTNL